MNIRQLCDLLRLESDFSNEILKYDKDVNYSEIEHTLHSLFHRADWGQSVKTLQEYVGEDGQGIKILTLYLHCLTETYDMYQEKGISDTIFRDTVCFISRFVKTFKEAHGYPAFVWAHWFPRQIALCEFRIGEYEYELIEQDDIKKIALHIPSDTNLKTGDINAFYPFAQVFYPEYANAEIYCNSWLLAPALTGLLPSDSNIIQFQKQFSIIETDEDNASFLNWIYPSNDIPYEKLPEKTTLQRNVKLFLLSGGKIGRAYGKYIGK